MALYSSPRSGAAPPWARLAAGSGLVLGLLGLAVAAPCQLLPGLLGTAGIGWLHPAILAAGAAFLAGVGLVGMVLRALGWRGLVEAVTGREDYLPWLRGMPLGMETPGVRRAALLLSVASMAVGGVLMIMESRIWGAALEFLWWGALLGVSALLATVRSRRRPASSGGRDRGGTRQPPPPPTAA